MGFCIQLLDVSRIGALRLFLYHHNRRPWHGLESSVQRGEIIVVRRGGDWVCLIRMQIRKINGRPVACVDWLYTENGLAPDDCTRIVRALTRLAKQMEAHAILAPSGTQEPYTRLGWKDVFASKGGDAHRLIVSALKRLRYRQWGAKYWFYKELKQGAKRAGSS